MKDFVLLDPHVDDFIFKPLSFLILRRKALKKYGYIGVSLQEHYKKVPVSFSYRNSSLPIDSLPNTMKVIIIFFEVLLWKWINKEFKFERIKLKPAVSVFFFGYKKLERCLQCLSKYGANRILVHLSHYHTFDLGLEKVPDFVKYKISLCFDNDIGELDYFRKKAPWYKKDITILPFCVGERFFIPELTAKAERVAVTGTFHDFSVEEAPFDWGIYNRGRLTLHPLRHELAQKLYSLPSNYDIKLSKFNSSGSALMKIFTLSQKKYFLFDIGQFYRDRKVALVAGEGTGAIAIGAIEAMASGCLVVLSEVEAKGNLLANSAGFIVHDGSYEGMLAAVNDAIYSERADPVSIREGVTPYSEEKMKEYFVREFII